MMSTYEMANELWGAVIYDIHLDMLKHNITFYIKILNSDATTFYELKARKFDSFNLNINSPEAWDYVELASISIEDKEDKKIITMELWFMGSSIEIECQDISISKIKNEL